MSPDRMHKRSQLWCKALPRRSRTLICASLSFAVLLLLYIKSSNFDGYLKLTLFRKSNAISIKNPTFPESIFFLETSGASKFNPRQACAVESAARHHQNSTVNVYMFTSNQFEDSFHLLSTLPNIRIILTEKDTVFADSPLRDWYQAGEWNESNYNIVDVSDASRLLMVWKYGGVYLDLDVVVLRPFYGKENFVIIEHETSLGNSVFGFERNHWYISKCLIEFQKSYKKNTWGSGGPSLFTKVFKSECGSLKAGEYPNCNVNLLPPETAYPILWSSWQDYFKGDKKNEVARKAKYSYVIHIWNNMSKGKGLSLNSGTAYEEAIKNECPLVYRSLVKSTTLNSSFIF